MKKKLIVLSSSVLGFLPLMASAQNARGGCDAAVPGTIQKVICIAGNILDIIIPILVVLGIVYFVWGVITFVIADDEESKEKGRNKIIFGIIGLVVIVAMWGLVGLVTNTFGLNGGADISVPTVPF
ncbi:MAG: pilin [Candidatus Paceibacterota bacterium]